MKLILGINNAAKSELNVRLANFCQHRMGELALISFTLLVIGGLTSSISAQESFPNGQRLFKSACAPCHGVLGRGDGPGAKGLYDPPKDLTTGWYKFRSVPHGQMPTDDDLFKTISRGVSNTMMPAFASIYNEDEIWDILDYLKLLTDRFDRWGPGDPITTPPELPLESATIEEGERVYLALRCWECHGVNGRGNGPITDNLKDDAERPIRPTNFTKGLYKSGGENKDLYNTINTGLSGTPMGMYMDLFLFTGDEIVMEPFEKYLSDDRLVKLKEYWENIPTEVEIEAMDTDEKGNLATQRKWALVHYLRSLERRKGLLYWLLIQNPEATR